jgi:hypothetical protein
MRMTNFQTDDPARTKLLVARGFPANRSMDGITFHPSQFSEVDEIVREFQARRTRSVGAHRRENPEAIIRSEQDLLHALTNGN